VIVIFDVHLGTYGCHTKELFGQSMANFNFKLYFRYYKQYREKKDIYAGQRGLSTARKNHDLVINNIEPIAACAFF
jgi:hypothetical protein